MINPALERHPAEAGLIGALVVGYSELDIAMVEAAGYALEMRLPLLDAVEVVNSELSRIEVVRRLAGPRFAKIGFDEHFTYAVDAQHFCREVRNHYAHCHYADFGPDGPLVTVKARDLFSDPAQTIQRLPWRIVSVDLLSAQERYFEHARKWWLWLGHAVPRVLKGKEPLVAAPEATDKPTKLGDSYTPP